MTLDEFKNGDLIKKVSGFTVYYSADVAPHLHRLTITYESGKLKLKDMDGS